MMNKKGIVGVLIMGMVFLFVTGFFFIMLYKVWEPFYTKVQPGMTGGWATTGERINTVWVMAPIVIIIVIGIWVIMKAAKAESEIGQV